MPLVSNWQHFEEKLKLLNQWIGQNNQYKYKTKIHLEQSILDDWPGKTLNSCNFYDVECNLAEQFVNVSKHLPWCTMYSMVNHRDKRQITAWLRSMNPLSYHWLISLIPFFSVGSMLSRISHVILLFETSIILCRVAEVGSLSARAKLPYKY